MADSRRRKNPAKREDLDSYLQTGIKSARNPSVFTPRPDGGSNDETHGGNVLKGHKKRKE
jgi:hypothetical protein